MAKFGATHRQLIKDTNEGRIEPKEAAHVSTSILSVNRQQGRQVTRVGDTSKETRAALFGLAAKLGQRIGKELQQKEFSEGFAGGTLEGYKKLQENESFLGRILFGKSARLRGVQARMLQDQTENNYINNFKDLDTDSKMLSTEAYHAKLNNQLQETLKTFEGDAEIQEQLVKGFAANAKQLARNHTTKRQVWVDAERKRATIDNVVTAGEVLKDLSINGADEEAIADAEQRLLNTFKKPEGMHHVPYSETTASAIITHLQRGNETVLGLAEREGVLEKLRPEDRARVDAAAEIWSRDNDKRLYEDIHRLEQMSVNGEHGREEYARQLSAKYPTFNLNAWREADDKLEQRRLQEAMERQERQQWLVTNDSRAQNLSVAEKHEAFAGAIEDTAKNAIMQQRLEAQREAQYAGEELDYDVDEAISPDEIAEWQLDNPTRLTPLWQASQQTLPQLEQAISTMNQLVAAPEIDLEGLQQWERNMEFANTFKQADELLFSKHFKSTSEADRYAAMDYLVKDAGIPVHTAIMTLRALKDDKTFDSKAPVPIEDLEEGVDIALDEFTSQKLGKTLWVFDKSLENEDLFRSVAADHYERAYRTFKGNHRMAAHAARASVLRTGTVIANKFVPGGAVLDQNSYGGSADKFMDAWLQDERFQWMLTLSGFPETDNLDDENITMRPSPDGKEIYLTGSSNANGMPIFLATPLPIDASDFPQASPQAAKVKAANKAKKEEFARKYITHPGL